MARGKGGAVLEQGQLDIVIPEEALQLGVQYIPWELIHPDPAQPRKQADAELRGSIAQGGIRQPIQLRTHPELFGAWMIIDGERRWRSAEGVQALIPSIVRNDVVERGDRLRDQMVSNSGKPLTPVEEARALGQIRDEKGMTSVKDLAAFVGMAISTVSQRLNLLALGPWLPLVERGVIKYTHAVEVLLPYRDCPDAVHEAVVIELSKRQGWDDSARPSFGVDDDEADYDSAWEFRNAVDPMYRKHLYPIAKKKHDEKPIFNTSTHDAECTCGGVVITEHVHSSEKRRFCGNPDWWKPLEAEAKKAERAKAKVKQGNAASASSSVVKKGFYAPEGVKELGPTGYLDVPKGYARLVSYAGQYNTFEDGAPFDPADLGDVEVTDLALQGEGTYRQLLVRETPALAKAREAFAKKEAAAVAALTKKFRAKLEKAIAVTVRRDSAKAVLAAFLWKRDTWLPDDRELHDAAAYAGLTVGDDLEGGAVDEWDAWLESATDGQAAEMLEALVTLERWGKGEQPSVYEELQKLRRDLREAIAKRSHPWAKPPKGAKK